MTIEEFNRRYGADARPIEYAMRWWIAEKEAQDFLGLTVMEGVTIADLLHGDGRETDGGRSEALLLAVDGRRIVILPAREGASLAVVQGEPLLAIRRQALGVASAEDRDDARSERRRDVG